MHSDLLLTRHFVLVPMFALSSLCVTGTASGQTIPGHTIPPAKPLINSVGWYPKTVSYAPDESHIIVTACPDPRTATAPVRCTIMRYRFDTQQWQSLTELNAQASYDDVAYTWDGEGIFAQEYAACETPPANAPERTQCNHLVLLDRNGKKLRNLSTDPFNTYAFPSLTRDGTRVLYWGVSNELQAGMGGGAWDVKELDIATQRTVQKTDYQAAFPKTTPRYMPDGKRLMLVAEEYPKRPNDADFFVTDEKTGRRFRTNYAGRFGANLTVVVNAPNALIQPYFPVEKNMWLMVRDVSRDGKLAVFDRQGVGMCFRFIEEPLRKEECFVYKISYAMSAAISPSNKSVVIVNGGSDQIPIFWVLRIIDVATGEAHTIPMRW